MRLCPLLFLLLAAPWLGAQAFDPAQHFDGDWTPGKQPSSGEVRTPVSADIPPYINLGSSGDGDFHDRLTPAQTGLAIRADEKDHRTIQLAVDLGLAVGQGSVEVVELDRGATLAWHVQPTTAGDAYLCELRRGADGEFTLLIRVGGEGGFRQVPGLKAALGDVELPDSLAFRFSNEQVSATFGSVTLSAPAKDTRGLRPAIAVSDGRARIKDLIVSGTFAADWLADATQRQVARKALLRLRALATGGMIQGIAAAAYPGEADDLKAYTPELAAQRATATGQDAAKRMTTLNAISSALPGNALAAHEAGVALLQFGDVPGALSRLKAANDVRQVAVTRLALAEALRRMRKLKDAEAELAAARTGLPKELAADHALLTGAVQAAGGDLGTATQTLDVAARAHPKHPTLGDFAFSARSLTRPQGLVDVSTAGPLGLRVKSDMPERALGALLARTAPYVERIRYWLPGLAETLKGCLVIYEGPVAYLNAALLVAGDNIDNVSGMFLAACIDAGPTILACRGFGEDELLRTLVHELWHLAYAASGHAATSPRWIDEGMAVYLSSGIMRGQVIAFDRAAPEYSIARKTPALETPWMARAIAAGPMEFYLPDTTRQNYAASYALVWQLAATDSALMRKLVSRDDAALAGVRSNLESLCTEARKRLEKLERP